MVTNWIKQKIVFVILSSAICSEDMELQVYGHIDKSE